jgi:transcriptional regulator with XRE-family HTH domain
VADTFSEKFRRCVRKHLRGKGISLSELCRQAEIDKGTLSKFLNGDRGLSLESIDRLDAVLDVRFDLAWIEAKATLRKVVK